MREAMYNAELGDDVHQDDPTIKRLERMAAEKLGKEDALFVASGTMGNLVAVLTHCEEGDRVVVGSESHIHHYEGDGIQRLVDVVFDPLPNDAEGRIDAAALDEGVVGGSTPRPDAGVPGEHAYALRRVPITAGNVERRRRRSRAGDSPSSRRRPHLQRRRSRCERRCGGACGPGGLGHVLPLEGAVLPCGLRPVRDGRVHSAGAPVAALGRGGMRQLGVLGRRDSCAGDDD
jgi:hypothetical protein